MSRFKIIAKQSDVLPEVKAFQADAFSDERGTIWTIWEKENILPDDLQFNLAKFTKSTKGVLRGLHGCFETWKYMSVPYGEVEFVVADVRKNSPNYLKWEKYVLSDKNHVGILVPPGFANAHLCISDECLYHYMMSYDGSYVEPHDQVVIQWNDPRLGINWNTKNPVLSARDKNSNI